MCLDCGGALKPLGKPDESEVMEVETATFIVTGHIRPLLAAGEKLTSRRCEEEFGITRDTAARDFGFLLALGVAIRQGSGRSTSYVLAVKT